VSKTVCFGAEPIKIPEALIQQIKLREQGVASYAKSGELPQPGDKVDILESPFEGLQALYSRTDGQQRSIVIINLLHQKTPVSLANSQIKK